MLLSQQLSILVLQQYFQHQIFEKLKILSILSSYTTLTQCYSDKTQLEVSQLRNLLIVHLQPKGNKECEKLPPAIIIQLTFTIQAKDVQIVLTNFSYRDFKMLEVPVPDITDYFEIVAVKLTIKSYNQIYEQQLQEITRTRNHDITMFSNLIVEYDQNIFTALVTFPNSFTSFQPKTATLRIVTSAQQYIVMLYGTPTVDINSKTVKLEFDDSSLSPILYGTDVDLIQLECVYGTDKVETKGIISTRILAYKNQPSPGMISSLDAYTREIFLRIHQTDYFTQELDKSNSIKLYITLNNDECHLTYKQSSSLVKFNIETNQFLRANIDESGFLQNDKNEMSVLDCLQVIRENGKSVQFSISFYDSNKVPINKVIMFLKDIKKPCYTEVMMTVQDSTISILAKNGCKQDKVTKQKLKMTILIYSTVLDYFLDRTLSVASTDFELNGDLDVIFNIKDNQVLQLINNAYKYRLLISTQRDGFVDALEPFVATSTFQEIIVFNVVTLFCCIAIIVIFGGLNIFYKKNVSIKKKMISKIEMDEI
ncbi:hypothetical protein SS50377_28379 [Spironucleus salmonicida]|uniref:Transmembrane protein n=1 Tax=Spironucleus salmonicida TaxID=348837 RepID=V6M7W9_9EUKA|nr:hypothetical protein SS50377_28379 [Spironucleus salmonicida]|eukprot:EST49574.1 Hypothetical protein SS50377_10075 [Spironucleus salmonicida]